MSLQEAEINSYILRPEAKRGRKGDKFVIKLDREN